MNRIGRYTVIEKIGEGGFGEVYEGFDPNLKRRVAIKTCRSRNPEVLQRFENEAALSAALDHRNITATYDFSVAEGATYMVQEYLEGEDLDRKIASGEQLSFATRISTIIQLARGLAHAHERGIVHRDVKPSNIRILPDGQVKLMDFGIAQSMGDEAGLTLTGETMGTAAYLSPEQVRGEPVDARCDIYSFGITAYELLTMRPAYPGDDVDDVLRRVVSSDPPPVRSVWPECPESVAAILERCYARRREDRFDSFQQVLGALDNILGDDAPQRSGAFRSGITSEPDLDDDLLDRPTMIMTTPATGNRSAAARPGLQSTPRHTGAAPGESGPSLLRFTLWLLLMGVIGASAAAWFFTREDDRDAATGAVPTATDASAASAPPSGADSTTATGPAAQDAASAGTATLVLPATETPRVTATVGGRTLPLDRPQRLELPATETEVLFRLADDPGTVWDESATERRQVRLEPGRETSLSTSLLEPGTVTVRPALGAPTAYLRVDGRPLGWMPLAEAVLPPGRHEVSAFEAPDASDPSTTFTLEIASATESIVTLDLSSREPPRTVQRAWSNP